MCGIAGIFNVNTRQPVSDILLKEMTDTLIHRGPDDEGFYIANGVGLGHRRLSIIDLSAGHQPMSNEDDTVWVVFNGEIYNYPELRALLEKKGHVFKTRSDTEAIIHLYEEEGEECFRLLRGMFAIALWDERKRKLVLGRDRVGKKPLFYYYDGSRIVFASEIKAILKVPGICRDIDLEAVSDYFSLLYVPAPKSIYTKIRKLRPGHYLTVSERGLKEVEYWDLSFRDNEELSEQQWIERLLASYREAVRIRLMSDVPLGAFLSGGVDSSSVVAMMAEAKNGRLLTSSIGFEDEAFNELPYAREVARYFDTEHHEQIVRPDAVGIVEKLAWHYDEPFADSSAVPTYYVSKTAREHVTVALSGDGGDENFAGYRRYYFDQRENWLRSWLPSEVRRPVFGTLASLYPKADWAPRIFRGKATFENLARAPIEAYFRSVSAVQSSLKRELLHPDVMSHLASYDSLDVLRHYYDKADTEDTLSRIQYVDIKTYLTDDILTKVDRASMANSLEVRAPILDHKFMELAARIPSSLKLRGRVGKYIFKKTLEPLLPQSTLTRPKMGFAVPLARWFRHELKEMAHEVILGRHAEDFTEPRIVEKIWGEHQRGFRDRSTELWTLLMFRLWQRRFLPAL
ncbi:MAG: amidotransferase 1, exosortase A system-associated [Deltaproteobacteria bacterium]|nr:MAG: amidotransferase 1, exosortase A system-associated [Deltaproteobacteria bacterium]